MYDFSYTRRVLELDGHYREHALTGYAFSQYRQHHPRGELPRQFVDAHRVEPGAHLAMQAALQPYVDNSISKTINVPRDYSLAAFKDIYRQAHELSLKGCTTFRPNPVTGLILAGGERPPDSQCCNIEREAD